MTTLPAITALMPVRYTPERHLRAAVRSLFDQTSPSWRLLAIVEPGDLDLYRTQLSPALHSTLR